MRTGLFPHEYRLINGAAGDPAVFFFFPTLARAVLFDLGHLEAISNRELLKVTHVFISHTHIDHFIGFDRLLRVNIPHFRVITIYGPTGIMANVSGKLKGYTWNLLEPGQIAFDVVEIGDDGSVSRARIANDSGFMPVPTDERRPAREGWVIEEFPDQSFITALGFDHGTTSMAYRYHSPRRYGVKSEVLEQHEWQPGPWIRDLQMALNQNAPDALITPEGASAALRAGDLADLMLMEHVPFSAGYLTDLAFTADNLARCRQLMHKTTLLLCEATFADADVHRAVAKKHLTAKQTALMAAVAEAKQLEIFHVSGIYGEECSQVCFEAQAAFALYRQMSPDALERVIQEELETFAKTT